MTDSKPGSRVELVDAYGRPIGTGTGSTTGSGSGTYPYTTGTGSGSFPIGTKPGATGSGGSFPGSNINGNGGSGPGSSYTNGRQNGKQKEYLSLELQHKILVIAKNLSIFLLQKKTL